ncbi:MAG: tRNA glutamyl-Q(34) synthetase GluQRS [Deltaproteobacteria bacterium]|nr:tRNA glutamyl-Q(34) synthetase GluQRS [Deltaproteobacteria bacterium]
MKKNFDLPRGRYAPTPSGHLHIGNARTALVAWLSVRAAGGSFVMRVEDLDGPRTLPGLAEAVLEDLAWMGLDWDEGPDLGGAFAPYTQSQRFSHYQEALAKLAAAGYLFPCSLSRKDLRQLATAPHGPGIFGGPKPPSAVPPYPKFLRPEHAAPGQLAADWFETFLLGDGSAQAIRFRVHDRLVSYSDLLQGELQEQVDEAVGDFVLKRKDGVWAYQLAVVVDDIAMGINEVVRGVDLIDSTARQIQLIEALGGDRPTYGHVPMVLNEDGDKLSKRNDALTIGSLREIGIDPRALIGALAHSLGLRDTSAPCAAGELVTDFSWQRLHREDWRMPDSFAQDLAGL